MLPSFSVKFRRNRNFFDVYLHDVSPSTFQRKGGGLWGYYQPHGKRTKFGLFGEIHLVRSRVRVDVVAHEIDHLRCDWIFSNGIQLSRYNEEWYCKFGDELIRNFYHEYNKYTK